MKDEIIYKYLDDSIRSKREKILRNTLSGKNFNKEELEFYDLHMYDKNYNFRNLIYKMIYASKINKDIILTKYQIEILDILENHNIFLSAPTSFGKTFIMLEFIKRNINKLNNIVFIIPTIALMNELLKKIYKNFKDDYNICINSDEVIKEKNIFVFVPERSDSNFVEATKNITIDLLVFDEIYKLQGTANDVKKDDRLIFMNKVYLELVERANKICLLGPYISNVEFGNTKLDIVKYYTNYMPIYNQISMLDDNEKWEDKIEFDHELIYFSSPQSIYKNINKILNKIPENPYYESLYNKEIEFLENNVGKEWYVIDLLKRGIGIHHGKTPMYLRSFYENEYNKGNIKILLCTDTLMEGINTPTESLVIVDNPGNTFKLNNLIGRVGRLNPNNPKIGNVLICDKDILNDMLNINSWLDLKIRAEDEEIYSDDEVLYLKKEYKDLEKKQEYDNKIKKLSINYNITKEEMIEKNLELNKTLEFMEENLFDELNKCNNIYECIKIATSLIKAPIYMFTKSKYIDLDLSISYLPYKIYINELLNKKSIKEIINEFNDKFNKSHNRENINVFIDGLYVLINYIKFKMSKLVNYIEVAHKEIVNENVNKFIALISGFNKLETSFKILDDLGIESNDAKKILDILEIDNNVSVSMVLNLIKEKRRKILEEDLSPFSKNNIDNM